MSVPGDTPLYLRRYRERAVGRPTRPESDSVPLYLRRFRSRSSQPEAGPSPGCDVIEVHLVRHGQTQGYSVDGGLTPLGAWQARRRGHEISKTIEAGEAVILVAAETTRTLRTAEYMLGGIEDGLALYEKVASVSAPELMEEMQNWRAHLPSGLKDPTQAFREYQVTRESYERTGETPPVWVVEMERFWKMQGGDPQGYWMTTPMIHLEPPALAVRRFWAGLVRLAREKSSADRLVCSVNSGPMRAFAATALGYDLGEPHNAEEVRVRLGRDLQVARVSYRGHSQEVQVPPITEHPGWEARKTATRVERRVV